MAVNLPVGFVIYCAYLFILIFVRYLTVVNLMDH